MYEAWLSKTVFPDADRGQFWQIKNNLEKMTAVASLTHV